MPVLATKIIVLGYPCSLSTSELLTSSWVQPNLWTATDFGDTVTFDAPEITICLQDARDETTLKYEFIDKDGVIPGNFDWITYD